MRAMAIDQLGGVDHLALRELPRPETGPDEALIRVATVGINRQDLITMVGRFPNPHLRLPHVPGLDPAGTVVEVGSAVSRLQAGDRVVVKPPIGCGACELCLAGEDDACPDLRSVGVHRPGGLAEYVAVPERNVFPIPAGVSFGEATAAAHTFPVALTLLRRVGVNDRDTVLVTGASGSLGSAVVQVASLLGARVIAAVGGSDHVAAVQSLGPLAVIDYAETPGFSSLVKGIVPGGVTVHVETSADPTLWTEALACLARRGRVAVIGAHAGPVVQLDLNWLFRQRVSIIGCSGSSLASFGEALELLASDRIAAPIDRVVSLAEAPAAYRRLMGRDHHGKTIVDLSLTS
jgi:NADPH:quinone reductase-like Zn-dependent oxidoreductase